MKLFESKKMTNSHMRALYGGGKVTGMGDDYVDDAGKTTNKDCSTAQDAPRVAASTSEQSFICPNGE
jgi:hypothetical protein